MPETQKLYTMRGTGKRQSGLKDLISEVEKNLGRGLKMVEIGSYAGESSSIWAESGVFDKVVCVDAWKNGYDPADLASNTTELAEKKFDEIAAKHQCIEKLKCDSLTAAKNFDDGSLDLVYIDATHTYNGVKADIEAWLPKVRKGGIISGHDYSKGWPGVVGAIDEKFGKPDMIFDDASWMVLNQNIEQRTINGIIRLYYWNGGKNAGDIASLYIAKKIYAANVVRDAKRTYVSIIGTVLRHQETENSIICGCGMSKPKINIIKNKNHNLYRSVRGKLTRDVLKKSKICSDSIPVGDPGLLISKVYDNSNIKKTNKIGVIPHFLDYEFCKRVINDPQMKVINICTDNIENLIDEILSCEMVISSSLHGMVFSHAYGIPAAHFSKNKLPGQPNFKFKDYLSVFGIDHNVLEISDKFPQRNDIEKFISEQKQPSMEEIFTIQHDILSSFPKKELFREKYKRYLSIAICAVAKNEDNYINDWIKYHINIGIKRIYLYDNNDSVDIGTKIDDCYKKYITIINCHGKKKAQWFAYEDSYKQFNMFHDWIAYIDIDEFITLNGYTNINDVFFSNKYCDVDVVRLSWKIYGDDDLIERDVSIPVYEQFKEQKYLNHDKNKAPQAKSIVRCGLKSITWESVHWPKVNGQLPRQCMPNKSITHGGISTEGEYSTMFIRHYMTKTISEFISQKLNRGDAARDRQISLDYFFNINNKTEDKLSYIKRILGESSKKP